ncbi:MAG TPA: 16S rRNA (guanine(966)-N(2))-methyltransferase RsmD [Anaerolinea thermolimosa]|uniref:16S rRNA (Guanine(966)-N(2))-methyltransferase RsmD n=1 Tax=Anaerolinea thermolimosa TaxID=229919 RepID=A0A3D1JI15_9CHLR|nr:16S rRNA (guanine(966)-N(2))-methyltransferase RsmD [Anaerolinea thermolimosa]GAP06269.1 RNA methyltransferase, RsmD family [Anaerolinea thermolimosa]HCE17887.1 16S rRNA (guanine(966)-N(2))-methyltransferase RsmD [Anaerolinea thermolimosa]
MANPRIISGKARGMRLRMVPGDITRPITDVVKEALFNIIGNDIINASFLDLFGGTGSVGIEALSRGAAFSRFIDLHRAAVDTIRYNLEHTRLKEYGQVLLANALHYLKQTPDRQFDYIYIAPPQYKGLWDQALSTLDQNIGWLAPDGWVIIQIDPVEYHAIPLEHLEEFDQRKYGNTLLIFYTLKASSD